MGQKVLEMSTIYLDKNNDFVLTVNKLPSREGNYRIAVVAIYSHRYTSPFTVKGNLPSSIEIW
jgi:hypothetical protein